MFYFLINMFVSSLVTRKLKQIEFQVIIHLQLFRWKTTQSHKSQVIDSLFI